VRRREREKKKDRAREREGGREGGRVLCKGQVPQNKAVLFKTP